jgi:hypothetical protein
MAAKKAARKPTRPKAPRAPAPVLTPAVPASIVERMDQEELDQALATGQHREALEEYFGPELYRELSVLAGEVQRRRMRGGPPVAILPRHHGIHPQHQT